MSTSLYTNSIKKNQHPCDSKTTSYSLSSSTIYPIHFLGKVFHKKITCNTSFFKIFTVENQEELILLKMIFLDRQVITFDILNKVALIILIIRKLIKNTTIWFLNFPRGLIKSWNVHEFTLHAFFICTIHGFLHFTCFTLYFGI